MSPKQSNYLLNKVRHYFLESGDRVEFKLDSKIKIKNWMKLRGHYWNNSFSINGHIDPDLLTTGDLSDKNFTLRCFKALKKIRLIQILEQKKLYKQLTYKTITPEKAILAKESVDMLPEYLKINSNPDLPVPVQEYYCANFPNPFDVSVLSTKTIEGNPIIQMPQDGIALFQDWPIGGGNTSSSMFDFSSCTSFDATHLKIAAQGIHLSPTHVWPGNIGDMSSTYMFSNSLNSDMMSTLTPHAEYLFFQLYKFKKDGQPLQIPKEDIPSCGTMNNIDFSNNFNNFLSNANTAQINDLSFKVSFVVEKWSNIILSFSS